MSRQQFDWEEHPDHLAVLRSVLDPGVWRVDIRNGDMSDTLIMGGLRAVKRYAQERYQVDGAVRIRWVQDDVNAWHIEYAYPR